MRVNNADGVRHVTRAEWNALREQFKRVLADSAEARGVARQAVAEAVERRLRSEDDRFSRNAAAAAQ